QFRQHDSPHTPTPPRVCPRVRDSEVGPRPVPPPRKAVMSTRLNRTLLLAALLAAGCMAAVAQSGRGVITGIVRDSSGAIVPGAEITIVEKATGVVTTATTTDAGVYRAPHVPPGTYKISASLPGFKT